MRPLANVQPRREDTLAGGIEQKAGAPVQRTAGGRSQQMTDQAARRLRRKQHRVIAGLDMPRRQTRHRLLGSTAPDHRSEEHTSALQSLMRNSSAVFCLKKKTT